MAREAHLEVDAGAYAILCLVHNAATATVTGLRDRLGVGKATVSRQVSTLEALGLVQRRAGEDDHRIVRLGLTPEGARRLSDARDRRDEQFRELLGQWPVQDLTSFADLLARCNELER